MLYPFGSAGDVVKKAPFFGVAAVGGTNVEALNTSLSTDNWILMGNC